MRLYLSNNPNRKDKLAFTAPLITGEVKERFLIGDVVQVQQLQATDLVHFEQGFPARR